MEGETPAPATAPAGPCQESALERVEERAAPEGPAPLGGEKAGNSQGSADCAGKARDRREGMGRAGVASWRCEGVALRPRTRPARAAGECEGKTPAFGSSQSVSVKDGQIPRCPSPLRASPRRLGLLPRAAGGGGGFRASVCTVRGGGKVRERRGPPWPHLPAPPAPGEGVLVEKEDSAALRWGVGVTSGRVTDWGGNLVGVSSRGRRWAVPP